MTGTTLRRFRNRSEAGRLLADELREYSGHKAAAFGAIAPGGTKVINKNIVEERDLPEEWIQEGSCPRTAI